MIKLPEYIIDEVTSGDYGFDDIEYKICDPESKWYDKFSFHDKLFIINKIFDSEQDWDHFEKVVSLIDEKEFFSVVEKLKGMQVCYDGCIEDMAVLRDIINTITCFCKQLADKVSRPNHEEFYCYDDTASPYFFNTIFHCFSPQTVFAFNKKLDEKSRYFYDSDETLLHYDEVVPKVFKKQLKKIYETNWDNLFSLPDGNNLRKFMPRKLFGYYLRAYTLCQAICSTRWGDFDPSLPYPVTILKIYNDTGRVWKNYRKNLP